MASPPLTLLGFESAVISLSRLALFYMSRKYLLRSLYHDLQDLSSSEGPAVSPLSTAVGGNPASELDAESVELDVLPSHTPTKVNHHHHHSSQHHHPRRNRTFHSVISRTLFSLSFSESCTLFILLMCQGLDIFHPRARLINWKISLYLLLTLIMVLIPLSYSLVLSYRSSSASKTIQKPTFLRIVISALPIGLFTYVLSLIPLPAAAESTPQLSTSTRLLLRLVVVGIVILGLLSGFGAADSAWTFLPWLSRRDKSCPTDQQIAVAKQGLERVRSDLARRREEMARRESTQPQPESSWLGRMVPNFRGGSGTAQEIAGLEALESQMSRSLDAMKERQKEVRFANTLRGRLFQWGGVVFALYCVYRVMLAIANLLTSPNPTNKPSTPSGNGRAGADFLTMALARLTSLHPAIHLEPEDVAVVARQISLGLVGIIILSSIRRVLGGVARALRVTSRNLGASLMLLMVAQLMGIYLLSTLIQLRTSFPPLPSSPPPLPPPSPPSNVPNMNTNSRFNDTTADTNLFATLPEYQIFNSLFDGSFLLAAALRAFVLWFDERVNGGGHDDGLGIGVGVGSVGA